MGRHVRPATGGRLQADLPEDQRLGIFILGVPRFRASVPYLAQAPIETFGNSATWRFFTGRAPNGQPQWVTHEEWMRGAAAPNSPRLHVWKPPGEPEIFVPVTNAGHCVGEFYVLNRYTGAASGSGPGRRSTIYWVVSSWNPYEVSVMRTTLQSDAR
jgi:hypothetical protein